MIRFSNLSFIYSEKDKPSINNINLSIKDAEFVLLTGPSGCGKTTLCRCINGLVPSFYGGTISGKINVQNIDVLNTPTNEMAKKVGMVFQDPENQLIATDVEREIAFGLENFGLTKTIMKKRIEEVLDTVGINHLRARQISTLSGGEKQKTAIASILAIHPEIIVLDEPTSELDPKGAEEVIQLVKKLNDELGITIVLVEHRIDRVVQYVDRIVVMNNGSIIYDGDPRDWVKTLVDKRSSVIGIPPIIQLNVALNHKNIETKTPLTIKEGRQFYSKLFSNQNWKNNVWKNLYCTNSFVEPFLKIKNLWYKYPNGPTVIKDITLDINKGEFVTLIGRNAAGKTTLAKILTGLLKPTKGTILINNLDFKKIKTENLARTVGFVFQDPNMHLFADTVEEEISFMMNNLGFSAKQSKNQLNIMLKKFDLTESRDLYPRSLSSGEKQRVALASVFSAKPELLILDEPTRGLDYSLKQNLMNYLREFQNEGKTVILISHDIELIAEFGNRVILMCEGKIIADGDKHEILSNSLHFSPQINRLIQPFTKTGISSEILTVEELMKGVE